MDHEQEMIMALVPSSYTVALPLTAIRELRREAGYPNNSALSYRFNFQYEWLCGFILKSNAVIDYMKLQFNHYLIQEWRMVPCAPSIGIFFPLKGIFIESAIDDVILDMHGMKQFGADKGGIELTISGLFLPHNPTVTRF